MAVAVGTRPSGGEDGNESEEDHVSEFEDSGIHDMDIDEEVDFGLPNALSRPIT